MSSPISAVDRAAQAPWRSTRSSAAACSIFVATAVKPRCSQSMAADRIAAVGSACCRPAMSGAEPCTGSNMLGAVRSGLMFPEEARPIPPWSTAPKSVMMSPNMLVVALDLRVVASDFGKGAHPEVVGEGEDVGLGHEGELPRAALLTVRGGQ